jgi:ribonuclease P/MRP protein subunit RPP1
VGADLCVRAGEHEKALEIGKRLGLDMIGLIVPLGSLKALKRVQEERDWRLKPRLALGLDASADKPNQMRKNVQGMRRSVELVVVSGGTEELNRAAVETPEVDVLTNHDIGGRSGINHVLARLAKKNGVSIGFDMNQLMTSYRLGRIQEFSSMVESARQVRKAGTSFIITSGARDVWDMRSPSELIAFGRQLGFTEGQARKGLTDGIVRENRKRLSGKWVMPGVEVE